MLESAWLFVGVVAILATGVALSTQTQTVAQGQNADGIAIITGIAGFLTWGVWTFGTLEIEVLAQDGSTVVFTSPSLTFLGLMLMLVPGYIALTGPAEIIRRSVDNPEHREV